MPRVMSVDMMTVMIMGVACSDGGTRVLYIGIQCL